MGGPVSFNTNSNKNMQTLLCLTFAAIVSFAQASKLDSIIQSKQAANSQIRAKRGIFDPDAMCQGTLRNPSCWEEFAETVWKPTKIFSSLVSRKEGWPLYWCVKQCNTIDSARDLIGTAHEEKREKKEEFCESMPTTEQCQAVEVGCPKCCEKIPTSVICVKKVHDACPDLDYATHCPGMFSTKESNDDYDY